MCVFSGWVAEVRSGGKGVKILPRVLFEGWSVEDYMKLFSDHSRMQEVADFITRTVEVGTWFTFGFIRYHDGV